MSLSKRLKPHDLEIICLDPEQWDLLPEVADHPSAWPALQAWIDRIIDNGLGPDDAGEPPAPPEGWKRGANKRPPKYAGGHDTGGPEPSDDRDGDDRDGDGNGSDGTRPDEAEPPSDGTPAAGEPDPDDDGGSDGAEPDDLLDEKPRRTLNGWRDTMLVPVVVLLLLALFAGGAVAARSVSMARGEQAAQAAERARADRERDRYATAVDKAERLLDKVKASPVHDGETVAARTAALSKLVKEDSPKDPAKAAKRVAKATAALDDAWGDAMDEAVETTGKRLKELIAKADGLNDAPDSDDRKTMRQTADEWRGEQVTDGNLSKAMKAADRLDELTGKVDQAKQDKARDDAEAQRKAQEEAAAAQAQQQPQTAPQRSSAPRSSGTSTKRSTSTTRRPSAPSTTHRPSTSSGSQSGSKPSWNVAPDSSGGSAGMPGNDGSL